MNNVRIFNNLTELGCWYNIGYYNKSFWGAFLQKGSKSKAYYKKRQKNGKKLLDKLGVEYFACAFFVFGAHHESHNLVQIGHNH